MTGKQYTPREKIRRCKKCGEWGAFRKFCTPCTFYLEDIRSRAMVDIGLDQVNRRIRIGNIVLCVVLFVAVRLAL